MKETRQHADQLLKNVKEYINTRLELVQLQAIEKTSTILSTLFSNALIVLCLVMAFLFGSLALGFYLSDVFESTAAGFGLVAAIYLVFAVIAVALKKSYLEKALVNSLIKKFFKNRVSDNEA